MVKLRPLAAHPTITIRDSDIFLGFEMEAVIKCHSNREMGIRMTQLPRPNHYMESEINNSM